MLLNLGLRRRQASSQSPHIIPDAPKQHPNPSPPLNSSEPHPSQTQTQEEPYLIYHNGTDTCNTRLLFESTTVPAQISISTLRVLTHEASLDDLLAVAGYRSALPIYSAYCAGSSEQSQTWLQNQCVWESYEDVVLNCFRDGGEKTYAEVLKDAYGFCDADDGLVDEGTRFSADDIDLGHGKSDGDGRN